MSELTDALREMAASPAYALRRSVLSKAILQISLAEENQKELVRYTKVIDTLTAENEKLKESNKTKGLLLKELNELEDEPHKVYRRLNHQLNESYRNLDAATYYRDKYRKRSQELQAELERKKKLLTPDEWAEIYCIRILDPDGWRIDHKDYNEPISREEFDRRMGTSTIEGILLPSKVKFEQLEAELAEMKEENRWIPVSEGLPKEGQDVIFINVKTKKKFIKENYPARLDSVNNGCRELYTHWKPIT